MKDSKLIEILTILGKQEWRRLGEFLSSPFFNKRADLISLYAYLKKIAPDFVEKKLDKPTIFKVVYPKQLYDERQMSYLMNYMLKQVEQFLGQLKIEKEVPLMSNKTLEVLTEKKLEKHYRNHLTKASSALEKWRDTSSDYYYYAYQLADIANQHFNNQNLRQDDKHLQLAYDNLDQFYFYKKLKYSCEMANRQKEFSTNYHFSFTKELVEFLSKEGNRQAPLIEIYFQIYATLTKADASENLEQLKKLIQKYSSKIPFIEKQHIYLYAINYCLRQLKGDKGKYYSQQSLDLYLEGIEKQFLLNDGFLSPWIFKNVVKLGFNLEKFDWTEGFIQQYHKKLEAVFQEDALHYNLADLNYRKKDYRHAQYHLLMVKFSDIFYTLGAKAMLIKIYYETEETEALFSLLASFSIYLKRNKKISNRVRTTYLNFTSLLNQLLRSKRQKPATVKEKIKNTPLLTDKRWLLQVCEELEKKTCLFLIQ